MSSIANSRVRFALGTGGTGYANERDPATATCSSRPPREPIFGPTLGAPSDTVPFFDAVGTTA